MNTLQSFANIPGALFKSIGLDSVLFSAYLAKVLVFHLADDRLPESLVDQGFLKRGNFGGVFR